MHLQIDFTDASQIGVVRRIAAQMTKEKGRTVKPGQA
jgi:hypothetical protein